MKQTELNDMRKFIMSLDLDDIDKHSLIEIMLKYKHKSYFDLINGPIKEKLTSIYEHKHRVQKTRSKNE